MTLDLVLDDDDGVALLSPVVREYGVALLSPVLARRSSPDSLIKMLDL